MSTIGNALALGILVLISLVFFRTRYYLTRASEYYRICLWMAIITAALNTLRLELVLAKVAPGFVLIALATVEFLLVFVLTSIMTLYVTAKITEHILTEHTLLFAKTYLFITVIVFSLSVIVNIPLKFMFYVQDGGVFVENTFSFLPYLILIPQHILVGIYCYKYRKAINRRIVFAIIESALAIVFILCLKLMYDIAVLTLALSLIQLIFLLDFQRQKMGVNSLTKLNDGRSFFSEVGRRKKQNKSFKAYLIWVENFKIIKQTYGQKISDEALYSFATALDHLFVNSAAFNMYGSHFTLLVDSDANEIDYTKKLIEFLEGDVELGELKVKFDYVVAEHTWQQDESSIDAFYQKLEYAAAIAQKNNLKFITYSLDIEIARLREKYLISRMQTITSSEGFEIWFQPVFSNRQNGFTSFEVLIRLKEKNGTFISPAEFIPIAEKTGQISAITWFVIEQTCHALAENRDLDGMRASINLPMVHLVDPMFEDKLNKIVDKYKIPHDRISFEFTERVILEDLTLAEKNMRRLSKSGYTFYLDDFGVGYSNFNCVLRLPLKTVKLDMSLTSTTTNLTENRNLVRMLTDLFHGMGLLVVAEGAENSEQVEILREFGVDGIQGYYFAKPMPLDTMRTFIKKNTPFIMHK